MNLGLKVFLYENGVLLKDVKNASLREAGVSLFYMLGCEIYFLELGEKEVLYLQNVLKTTRCNEVPVSIVIVLYE